MIVLRRPFHFYFSNECPLKDKKLFYHNNLFFGYFIAGVHDTKISS